MIQRRSKLLNMLGGAAILMLAVAVIYILASQLRTAPRLDRSAIGFDGLAMLLDEQGRSARTFSGGSALGTQGLGLRVLPLYGDDAEMVIPTLFRQGEGAYLLPPAHFIPDWVVRDKVEAAPTLIVLPKWSDGVRLSGLSHPDFLLQNPDRPSNTDPAGAEALADDLEADAEAADSEDVDANTGDKDRDALDLANELELGGTFERLVLPEAFLVSTDTRRTQTQFNTRFGDIDLRAPQFMQVPSDCRALIGDRDQALLMACEIGPDRNPYWVLSDPDMLNNHGLHLGENAAAALALIDTLSSGQEVVIDYSTFIWTQPDDERRTVAELLRYFSPPFAWIWLAVSLLFFLAWWRGAVRDRPLLSVFGHGHSGARSAVVSAQSRLMRNTGRDGALLRALARQRVLSLCDLLLGRDDRASNRQARMLAFVERRDPDLARRLTEVLNDTETVSERLMPGAAVALLTRLETAYEEARQLA